MKDNVPEIGGLFYEYGEPTYIKKVIYSEPATIVFWSDGSKSISKCNPKDKYDKEKGLAIAVMKRICGSSFVKNLLNNWVPENKNIITITDVRKNLKQSS